MLLVQMREEAEAGLQSLVEAAEEEVADTKASLRDCQDMLEEMQTFSEERQHEAAEAAARAEVGASQHPTEGDRRSLPVSLIGGI
jgi:Tfp pilus assembly protein FimV